MWNPLKTLSERDSARLRRLEKDFTQLADDVEMCMSTIPKINARLRARATRAAAAEAAEEETSSPLPTESLSSPASSLPGQSSPVFSKSQLREFARLKGLRA